jgi:cell division septation protein DedD
VQAGAYTIRQNADARTAALRGDGFSPYIVKEGRLFKVFTGAFRDRAGAERLAAQMRAKGYEAIIVP